MVQKKAKSTETFEELFKNLGQDLQSLRKLASHLEAARRDLLTKHRETQALNKKLLASEEELRAMNEELEATTEELRASNEELEAANEMLQQQSHDLNKRVKELNCLYGISKVVTKPGISLNGILQGVVNLIPPSWQYPEITCARITVENQEFKTKNFKQTLWKQTGNILADSKKIGTLEVFYLEKKPANDEGPFLNEERNLINAISERLGEIIEVKHAEETMQKERAYLDQLFESAPEAIVMADTNGHVIRVNSEFLRLFGYKMNEVIGKPVDKLVASENIYADAYSITKKVRKGRKVSFETLRRKKDGTPINVSLLASPIIVNGELVAVYGIYRNITERKKAEEELRIEKAYLDQLFNSAQEAIAMADINHGVIRINPEFTKLFGYTPDEAIGECIDDLIAPKDLVEQAQSYTKNLSEGKSIKFEDVRRRKDGSLIDVSVIGSPIKVSNEHIAYYAIYRDITERKKVEREIAEAKKEAEEANQAKSEFLAKMSHEIRTPMNGIIGMTDLALESEPFPEQKEYLDAIKLSAKSLLTIINDILDFSKIEAKKIELDVINFNLSDAISNTVSSMALQAHKKGLELLCYIPPNMSYNVEGDPGRLRQILTNLINNAIKFTEKGEVVVSVEEESKKENEVCLHFKVADTGIGIPKTKQQMIFNAFSQVDGSMTRQYGGTGLGLSISSQLVELMGGRIWVESKVGKGSTFHFTPRFDIKKGTGERLIPTELKNLEEISVLAVDDNATNRRILKEMLTSWRMKPTLAKNGVEALTTMKKAMKIDKPFTLILTDANMPGMDGFTLVEKINQDSTYAQAVIMMLTSAGNRGDAARCRQLGIAAYLTKPITQSELLDAIKLALGPGAKRKKTSPLITKHSMRESSLGLHILLAEDNIVNQKVAVRILEKQGHKVVVANNGREVLDSLEKQPFDLILMDVQMPEMDGFEATDVIRKKERKTKKHTPIVAMTAHAMKGDKELCLETGMDDYIAKPLKPEYLFKVIKRVVKNSQRNRKRN
ncbi:MAG: PAS domain S-box protein [Candidatus Aminicenantaceae bacterium]